MWHLGRFKFHGPGEDLLMVFWGMYTLHKFLQADMNLCMKKVLGVSCWNVCENSKYIINVSIFNGTPLQCSCLGNPMDEGAWWAAVHGVARSRTWLSDFIFIFHFHALDKKMATHSSVLAWRIPGTGESGGLPSMGSHRVGHNWCNLAAAADVLYCKSRENLIRYLKY